MCLKLIPHLNVQLNHGLVSESIGLVYYLLLYIISALQQASKLNAEIWWRCNSTINLLALLHGFGQQKKSGWFPVALVQIC